MPPVRRKMRVVVVCEYSGRVRDAFKRNGCDAWSCDILPTEAEGNHLQCDALSILDQDWDLMIAHPPCTHLSVSGARWHKGKIAAGLQQEALEFVLALMNAPIPQIYLENPVSVISSKILKPTQIIQPWQFGHGEMKTTCLWLKGLPKLEWTNVVEGREQRLHYLPPSEDRGKLRSLTYQGIADAMGSQWAKGLDQWGDPVDRAKWRKIRMAPRGIRS